MRFLLLVSALGALAMGLGPVAAQSRTSSSGLSRRISSDTCAFLNAPLSVAVRGAGPVTVGFINTCTCLSGIPNLEQTNVVVAAAVAMAGNAAVTASLTNMIRTAGSTCNYPDNAVPTCESNSPCGFTCGNGFMYSAETADCVCQSPNSVCGGQCKPSCPSAIVMPERRAASAYERVANRRRMCPRGYTACGIFEQRGRVSEPWECVDVRHDLESCGGCMTPFDMLSPRGVDCTAIPGVADVSCMQGSCVINRKVTSPEPRCQIRYPEDYVK